MNMQQRPIATTWKTTLYCLILLLTTSCADDSFRTGLSKTDSGIPVRVELSFRIPTFDNPQKTHSRVTREASDRTFHASLVSDSLESEAGKTNAKTRATNAPLYNLWVFQFSDTDGSVRKVVRASTSENPVYENQTLEVELQTGENQTIYILALGKQYGEVDLTNVSSLEELKNTTFDFVRYENGLPVAVVKHAEDVPYGGSCDKLSIVKLEENGKGYVDYQKSNGFGGAISLKALVSLVTIDFTYQVEEMTPFSISLNNVPTTFAVNSTTYQPSQFANLPTTLLKPADLADGKRVTMSWYTAPNPQGVVPKITSEADRYFYYNKSNTPTGDAPREGTFIHFWANKNADPTNYALYHLFLGSNTTDDFNIRPHSHYRYRTDINTADDLNDKRIIYKVLEQSIDFSASAIQKSLKLLRGNSKYDLNAHAGMRPIELTALRGTVSVEILPGSDNGAITTWPKDDVAPIAPSNSWLKLSIYPNYTEAFTANQKGDPNALTTSIRLNASIPGLFRLYLYNDEYEKYIQDNASEAKNKRLLFIRFTFQTGGATKPEIYTTRMDQRPAFYLGTFGGEPTMSNGEFAYPMGLVVETISEQDATQYLSYRPMSFLLHSAYGSINAKQAPFIDDLRKYGIYDTYNGRSATKMMAVNEHRISPIVLGNATQTKIQEPRYVNGYVDLYQYKYYTNDGFSQRWCYDKNRDNNGNGRLDENEIVWYMPAIWQVFSIPLNCYNSKTDYFRYTNKDFGINYLHSTTMNNNQDGRVFGFYNFSELNTSISSWKTIRCVRDVTPIVGASTGVKYYEKDGYPVIDATGLMEGTTENRVNNSNVFITPTFDDPLYKDRVIRYYSPESSNSSSNDVPDIERKVSRRFRVAPCDVDASGQPVVAGKFASITWAEAAGYNTAANTQPIVPNGKTSIAQTGCAVYKGVNSAVDETGKWRLPTIREALLIAMMNQGMEANRTQTNYIPLFYLETNSGTKYWTAAEVPDGNSEFYMNRAFCINAAGRLKKEDDPGNKNAWNISAQKKGNNGSTRTLARCIYDLP